VAQPQPGRVLKRNRQGLLRVVEADDRGVFLKRPHPFGDVALPVELGHSGIHEELRFSHHAPSNGHQKERL